MTKTRQITPHAMCRHMVRGIATFKILRHVAGWRQTESEKVGQDHEGYAETE